MRSEKFRVKTKRSDRIEMTNEARVLKLLRSESRLSMKQVSLLIGTSDSYIAHIETGRIDVPGENKLKQLLKTYGCQLGTYRERVRIYQQQVTPEEEIIELVKRMRQQELMTVLSVARSLVS